MEIWLKNTNEIEASHNEEIIVEKKLWIKNILQKEVYLEIWVKNKHVSENK